jgi:hypothetical protein
MLIGTFDGMLPLLDQWTPPFLLPFFYLKHAQMKDVAGLPEAWKLQTPKQEAMKSFHYQLENRMAEAILASLICPPRYTKF